MTETIEVNLKKLDVDALTPRMGFSEGWVRTLATDVSKYGQQKPIITRPHPKKKGFFQVVDGVHRCRAMKLLGREKIRAEVRQLSDEDATFLAMRINELHGKRLKEIEEGHQMFVLQKKFGWSQEKIGRMFGRSQPWVNERINLYVGSSKELQENFIARAITWSHARRIAELPKKDQEKVVKKVAEEDLSAKETSLLISALRGARDGSEKVRILESPVKALAQVYEEPEAFVEVATSKKEEIIETFHCPKCGTKLIINWPRREVTWGEKSG